MNEAGLQMLHDMYLNTGNSTGFWEAMHAYQASSSYRLVSLHHASSHCDALTQVFMVTSACRDVSALAYV